MSEPQTEHDQAASEPAPDTNALGAELEAVLMVIDEPVSVDQLSIAVEVASPYVRAVLRDLAADYDGLTGGPRRGFQLREVAGGWRIYSRTDHSAIVERFMVEGHTAKLTQAAMETLAVVAYLQPTTRSRVAGIRGVNSDSVMRTLVTRGLVAETGQDEQTGATRYSTTPYFLELLGVDSIDELPKLSPLLPGLNDLDEFSTGAEQ